MSNNRTDVIYIEYLSFLREIMSHHNRIILSYSEVVQNMTRQFTQLLQNIDNNQNSTNTTNQNYSNNNRNQNYSNNNRNQNSFNTQNNHIWDSWLYGNNQTTNENNTNTVFRTSRNRNNNYRNNRTYTRPFRFRNIDFVTTPPRRTNTRYRRRNNDLIQTILNNSLLTATTNPRPATIRDISRNTTIFNWTDISSTTDQTVCPITQENFTNNDTIMRINHCGHIFIQEALNTYLTEFDYRCPVCRHSIRSNLTNPSHNWDISSNSTDTSFFNLNTPPVNLTRTNSFWDISLNFLNSTDTDNPFGNITLNSPINNAINQISGAVASQLTSAMNNPDNSGNIISAEYSLYIPTIRENTDNMD